MEPREERFPKAERKPADAKTKASAEEAYESRPIDRRTKERARAPAPPAPEIVPAAIMVRTKAPRRIVNPIPAQRPTPVQEAVPERTQPGPNSDRKQTWADPGPAAPTS